MRQEAYLSGLVAARKAIAGHIRELTGKLGLLDSLLEQNGRPAAPRGATRNNGMSAFCYEVLSSSHNQVMTIAELTRRAQEKFPGVEFVVMRNRVGAALRNHKKTRMVRRGVYRAVA